MTLEAMLPLGYWNRKYVAAALPPQAGTCDTLLGTTDASIWRVMAAVSGTEVRFFGPPAAGLPATITLNAGEIYEAIVPNVSFTVEADQPVMVMQGMDCEPSLSPAVPVDQMLTNLTFAVPSSYVHMVDVVRKRGALVKFDDNVIDAAFVSAGPEFEVAQIALGPCTAGVGVCTHHLIGAFGMTLRGMDAVCSYASTAPTWATCEYNLDTTCVQ
jgi:hypothetical protein